MNGFRHTADDGDASAERPADRTGAGSAGARSETPLELRLTVVRHENGPDRGTIHPRGLTGIEQMETWLSADESAFVDLGAWR